MKFSVRHWIPGRIRLHVPALATRGLDVAKIVAWLEARNGVTSVRVNADSASLVVTYDEARRPTLQTLLGYLGTLSPRTLMAMVTAAEPVPDMAPAAAAKLPA